MKSQVVGDTGHKYETLSTLRPCGLILKYAHRKIEVPSFNDTMMVGWCQFNAGIDERTYLLGSSLSCWREKMKMR